MNAQPYMWKFNFPLTLFLKFTHKTSSFFLSIYGTQNRLSWGGEKLMMHTLYISSMSFYVFHSLTVGIVFGVVKNRVNSAEHLKRFSYLQTFPEQGHISSPPLDQQSSNGGL